MNPDFVIIGHLPEGSLFAQRVIEAVHKHDLNFIVVDTVEEAEKFDCKTMITSEALQVIGVEAMKPIELHFTRLDIPEPYIITNLKRDQPPYFEKRRKSWERPYKYHR